MMIEFDTGQVSGHLTGKECKYRGIPFKFPYDLGGSIEYVAQWLYGVGTEDSLAVGTACCYAIMDPKKMDGTMVQTKLRTLSNMSQVSDRDYVFHTSTDSGIDSRDLFLLNDGVSGGNGSVIASIRHSGSGMPSDTNNSTLYPSDVDGKFIWTDGIYYSNNRASHLVKVI